jgi:parallel beta-helix repeat protein
VQKLIRLALLATALSTLPLAEARAVDPSSELITCDHADEKVKLEVSSHLDPSCTWTRGVEILASDVVLDCQGAHIAAPDNRYGVLIETTTDVPLSNIVVRNCYIEGFLNNIRITRVGFRELAEGEEYENGTSNILIEDSTILNSRGVGIFVDGYVTGVTLRNLHVEGSGSTGIYLEAGSKDNVVEDNEIVNNGYNENGPGGQFFDFAGLDIFFWGIGREGLAIDGSRFNTVRNNYFTGNSAGGIFLYKNCGEFVTQRPERWWHRRYGADGNVIENNTFVGEDNGVWIASRMGEDTLPMECSDPAYLTAPGQRIVLDYADDNVVRSNDFQNVLYGIRVEDDGNVIEDNEFTSSDPADQAVIVGTRFRTSALGQPVTDTAITGNTADIAGNVNPYRWTNGHENTVFTNNQSLGRVVGLCEGVEPFHGRFVFVVQFQFADPENPPVGPPVEIPQPDPLPPCPIACSTAAVATDSDIALRRLGTPPGDDTLLFRGKLQLAHPFDPALDPIAVGMGVLVTDSDGNAVVDVLVPGGAYDTGTRTGWKFYPNRGIWKYVNDGASPAGGITRVVVKDLSRKQPGLVQFSVSGRRGSYAADPSKLPLEALLVLDPPTAETGQCGRASFTGPTTTCTASGGVIRCK